MNGNLEYLQLLFPLMMFVFAVGFGMLYMHLRKLDVALWLAMGHFISSIAFIIIFIRLSVSSSISTIALSSLFFLTNLLIGVAITKYFKKTFPLNSSIAIYLTMICTVLWFQVIQPEPLVRLMIITAANGVFLITIAWCIGFAGKNTLANSISGLLLFTGLQLIFRVPLANYLNGEYLTIEQYKGSFTNVLGVFLLTFHHLALAMVMFLALGMRIITNAHHKTLLDPLTNVLNRHGFSVRTERTIQKYHGHKMPLSLVICDIDNFKAFNQQYGHLCGDDMVVELANLFKTTSRENDIYARLSGNEFCALLWNTDIHGAKLFANAIRMQVSEVEYDKINPNDSLTASFGVAQIRPNESYDELYVRADAALRQAKASGRDKVCGPLSVELMQISA